MSRFIFRTPKPTVAPEDPSGGFLLELLITNGAPFKDHWAYWVRSHDDPDIGVKIHATGDVRNGFEFEIKRSENLRTTEDIPTTRVPLQWLDVQHFDERAMLNDGKYVIHQTPVCQFESIVYKVKAPGKSLNSVDGKVTHGRRITQRDCQTWIVESAQQLYEDRILEKCVVDYLNGIKQ